MTDINEVTDLARQLNTQNLDPMGGLRLRRGVVTAIAVSTATATVTIGGTSIPGVTCVRGAIPVVGDAVDVLIDGPAPRIVGVSGGINWITVGSGGGAPPFTGTWVQELNRPLSFGRDSNGFVHLRGLCKAGTGAEIFVLPSGYRPAALEAHLCLVPGGTTGNGLLPCQLNVNAAGSVQVGGSPASPAWLSVLSTKFFADGS